MKSIQVLACVKRTGQNRVVALILRISQKRAKLLITIKKAETNGGEIIRTRHVCDDLQRQTFWLAAAGIASDVLQNTTNG
jgi:hypothetical protein